ncbi:hypothetical protein ASF90_15140 [Xanthomonas sp. Leaf148]|nr:hypothetical protein ASF90_15140 [Xanthomonas sp. Leaf148]
MLTFYQRRGLKDIPPTGPLPVSVPGAVDGWFALHERFGRKPMAQNLALAIRYAREGHRVRHANRGVAIPSDFATKVKCSTASCLLGHRPTSWLCGIHAA